MKTDAEKWVERRYAAVLAEDPAGFVWDALWDQAERMSAAELAERLAEMDSE